MRIVHGSDWHAFFKHVPEAELYVFTGDMLNNFPLVKWKGGRMEEWPRIDAPHEREMQAKSIEKFIEQGGMRRFLGSPDAPIVCVRGNHDFVPIGPLFEGCNLVHEFVDNELIEVGGYKITGHRGIPYIGGYWNDEEGRADLKDRYRRMPMADIYVTHYPPQGILDSSGGANMCGTELHMYRGGYEAYGLEGLGDFLLYRGDRALHCFGHIHECGGHITKQGPVWFSNAACTFNEIDF